MKPISLRPDLSGVRPTIFQVAAAYLRAYVTGTAPEAAIKSLFKGDDFLIRAVSNPATLTNPQWAQIIAHDVIRADLIQKITGLSAAAALMEAGIKVDLAGVGSITIPGRLYDPSAVAGWIGEGMPIPVRHPMIVAGPKLEPKKLGVLSGFTNEMVMASPIVDFTKAAISEAAAALLDQQLFSTDPGDVTKPAGILVGATAVTPTSAAAPWAISSDIGALVEALAQYGGGLEPVIIAAPGQAASLRMWRQESFYQIFASLALPAGTVVAVEASSFVSAIGALPRFEVGTSTTIHEEDTTPTDIVSGGTVATPVKSYFTIDAIGLRMILEASWGLRNAQHVAIMSGTTW